MNLFFPTHQVIDQITPGKIYLAKTGNDYQLVRMKGKKQFQLCLYTDWILIDCPGYILPVPIDNYETFPLPVAIIKLLKKKVKK